jgi:6-pyruvoyltetrahydropterin/6-carboxytetrahydropterin synthase
MGYSLYLKKQNFKFSSSHFTIFNKEKAEFLHGHNYQVAVRVQFKTVDPQTEMAVDFNEIKKQVRALCDQLDEKILIPKKSTFLKIFKSPHHADHQEIQFHNRHYCFPENEIYFVDANNITSESLARYIYEKLETKIKCDRFSITVFETAGQAASYSASLD